MKFRLGSAGEPTICSHCYSVPYMKIPANNQVLLDSAIMKPDCVTLVITVVNAYQINPLKCGQRKIPCEIPMSILCLLMPWPQCIAMPLGDMVMIILMGKCKKDITPLLTHRSYVFLALTQRYKLLVVIL